MFDPAVSLRSAFGLVAPIRATPSRQSSPGLAAQSGTWRESELRCSDYPTLLSDKKVRGVQDHFDIALKPSTASLFGCMDKCVLNVFQVLVRFLPSCAVIRGGKDAPATTPMFV